MKSPEAIFHPPGMNWRWLWQEYLSLLGSRRSKGVLALFLMALLATPFVLEKPPAELVHFIGQWLGMDNARFKLVLFAWTDLSMNKLAVLSGLGLASGLLVSEQAKGLLTLLRSKPVSLATLYGIKLLAAVGVFVTWYTLVSLLALWSYAWIIPEFSHLAFLALSLTHIGAGIFSVCLCGLMALCFQRRLNAMVTATFLLFLLIGTAFLGFYNPHLLWLVQFNPFYHGVSIVTQIQDLSAWAVLQRILTLMMFNGVILGLGLWRAQILEKREAF
jgi:ABC-2 type transport system permease protein